MKLLFVLALLQAQNATPRPGFRAAPAIYQQNCGTCHDGQKAPSITDLQQYSPEQIYEVLTTGKMKDQAAQVPDVQKRQIAEFLAARPMGSDEAGDIKKMTNACPSNPAMGDPAAGPSWNGWSPGDKNTRFQTATGAGLTAAQIPNLKLKWAFGVPKAAEMHSQPTIASGRVFFGSDAGYIYSLDAKTGCVYWAFHADSGTRTAPTIAPIKGQGATKYAVYFVDVLAVLYALDAQTGKLLWKTKVDANPAAQVTANPVVAGGKVIVGVASNEEADTLIPGYPCCTFRGSMVALDVFTGAILWKTFTVPDNGGVPGGYSGNAIWSPPAIDAGRGSLYIGTGNNYTVPDAVLQCRQNAIDSGNSDANCTAPDDYFETLLSLDLTTGAVKWARGVSAFDAWTVACLSSPPGPNCP